MKVDRINLGLSAGVEKHGNGIKMEENDAEATKKREEKIVGSWCSFQSRMGPPEYRKWRRVHGLQLPLHPQQVAGWVILLAVGAATFLVLIPALRPFFRECLFAVLATLFILHILSHLAALLLDPADPELRALKVKLAVPEFDRTKHAHVIENGRCHLCNIKTSSPKTKHCSVCNKCIDHFDHHCKWLNHCIGGRNYVPFLICVVTAVAASLVVVGVSVLEIVYYNVDPGLLNVFASHQNGTTPESFLPDSVFLGIISILGLLAATTAGLLLHLCLFHCYISVLGITTYEYIRNYRQDAPLPRVLPWTCNYKKTEVLSNHVETSQRTRSGKSKFVNCCYYSCSRPPEDDENQTCCSRAKVSFFRTKEVLKSGGKRKKKTLERQNTDPEFVDRVIKPFLITLSDEKNEADSKSRSCVHFVNERKCGCGEREHQERDEDSKQENPEKERIVRNFSLTKLGPKILRRHSAGSAESSGRIKCNQIRPSTAEELNRPQEKISVIKTDYKPEGLDLRAFTVMQTKVLPELNDSLKRLRTKDELKELSTVLDLVDQPNFGRHLNYRKLRKKSVIKRPRSPLLSPIRESGLSNPGSPRVDLIMPPTPVFVRPQTPETSMIFLSNPNSPSSSDEEDTVSPPTPIIHRQYNSGDILKTPQLPRKVYGTPKDEQIFILKPSRLRMDSVFWTETLGCPRLVVAPMVDASELAWRILSRRHGAQLCYTPMLHSLIFIKDARYRKEGLASTQEDRPLIVQFCGNDAESLLEAARLASPFCDAVDINLGCPQAIAKRGRYGAYLQDDWPLLQKIVGTLRNSLSVPVTCKIRVYEDINRTVEYAKMLEKAGCQLLTVHGRTKEQKGPLTGLASWEHIKAVKENVSIPVLANGNIQCLQDVYRCLEVTNCDGVMSAEGSLYNPAIFESRYPPSWEMALEYLDLVEQYPCPLSYVRGHLFKIFHHVFCLPENKDMRTDLATKSTVEDFRGIANTIRDRYLRFHEGVEKWEGGNTGSYDLVLPPWLCKPYERPPPNIPLKKTMEINKASESDDCDDGVSSKRLKEDPGIKKDHSMKKKYQKLMRFPQKAPPRTVVICSNSSCPNPMGLKCDFKLCKTCCRSKCFEENNDCPGHGILIKTRREKAKMFTANQENNKDNDDFRENITDDILIKVV